jgi:hypothetical protein
MINLSNIKYYLPGNPGFWEVILLTSLYGRQWILKNNIDMTNENCNSLKTNNR